METGRRQFLKTAGLSMVGAAGSRTAEANQQIRATGFPVFDVHDFGATPDGSTVSTEPIRQAIVAASQNGGGVVYFPPGDYLSGTIELKDRVTLYLEAGATIYGSKEKKDYNALHNSLVHAENATDAAIRGRGTIDGNGPAFWQRVNGRWDTGPWEPSGILNTVGCKNLLLEGVTLRNSPGWTVHPVDCDRLTIHGISIINAIDPENQGPNTDGIDPDACTRVRISDCYIQSGDDCIVLKVTNRPGGNRSCSDIAVTNCVLATRETALKIGSETYGEFRNITFSNCAVKDAGCGVGLWMRDGGIIEGWTVDNISMTLTGGGTPIYMTSYPRSRLFEPGDKVAPEKSLATVRNVMVSNVTARADGGIFLQGMEEKPLDGIVLDNIHIRMRGATEKPLSANPPYPFPLWGHQRAPYDIYCRYVHDLKLRNVQLTWESPEKPEWSSAIRCRNLRDVEIDGFVGRQALGSDAPAIWLRDTRNAFIHNCRAEQGTGDFLKLDQGSEHVTLLGNELSEARKTAVFEPGVSPDELFESGNRLPR
ncbi:MAG: glycoside hydrolase family 28 protein [Terracidiphilus sp.]